MLLSFLNNVKRMLKNAAFFYKECKKTPHTFRKNVKERKDRSILLKRTEKNAKIIPFIYKERKRT